jgi:hypothetical protein
MDLADHAGWHPASEMIPALLETNKRTDIVRDTIRIEVGFLRETRLLEDTMRAEPNRLHSCDRSNSMFLSDSSLHYQRVPEVAAHLGIWGNLRAPRQELHCQGLGVVHHGHLVHLGLVGH